MVRLPRSCGGGEAVPICGEECKHDHACSFYPLCNRILHDQLIDVLDAIREDAMRRRIIEPGMTYEAGEDVELVGPPPRDNPPPEWTRGEPWGWPDDEEHRDKPRGWREDGRYDST